MSSHAVVCLCVDSWSRDGHKLLSAATDNTVSIWDIVSGDCDKTFRFPSPILKVQFHPRDRSVPPPLPRDSSVLSAAVPTLSF